MRFVISGEQGWVDPATLRLAFKLQNNDAANELQLSGGAHVLFDEVRLLCSGQEVERITQYGRTHELFRSLFMSADWNQNEAIEDGRLFSANSYPQTRTEKVNRGSTLSFNMTPLLGFMSSGRYLPIRYAPLKIHFTLASANDALDTAANSPSRRYAITQAEMRYSAVRLDSSLESGFASMLLQGRALQINFRTIMSQVASIPADSTSFQTSMVRALSRIAGVFVTFVRGEADAVPAADRLHTRFVNPSQVVNIDAAGRNAAALNALGQERTLSWALQMGGKQWPEMGPSGNLPETFSLLRQAVNVYNTGLQTLAIRESGYNTNQFAIGVPTSIVPGNAFASVSSRSGDLLTIKLNSLQPGFAAQAQVSILAEIIVEIREGGVTLLE